MAEQVKVIASIQSVRLIQQSGSLKSFIDLGLLMLRIQLSTSYLRQSERNRPGMIISPSPRILNLSVLFQSKQGNKSLRGKSIFLATVTITSDSQTQYKSQRNRSQRVGKAILNDLSPAYFNAVIAKQTANKLLSNQCLEIVKMIQKMATKEGQSMYLEAFYIHFKYFYYKIILFGLSLSCSITYLQSLILPQAVVAKTKIISSRVFIVISLTFFIRKQRDKSTTHPIAGYFMIYQQFYKYFQFKLLDFSYYSHCLIYLQEALPKLTERIEPMWIVSPALITSCEKMGSGYKS